MRKLILLGGVLLVSMVIMTSLIASEKLIDFDKNKRVCYFSEEAWYSLPMTGTTGKIELLKKINQPPGWEVRGMYTNKLLAVIKSNGDVDFK